MAFHLTSERLLLRPWDLADAAGYQALVAERGDGTPSLEDILARISRQLAAAAETGISLLAVRRRAEGDFIGYCGLIPGRRSAAEPEIAFELYQRVHGRGYATEAAGAILHAAAATGRVRVWATVRSWNAPSLRVLDKLGFTREHTSTDDRGELIWLSRPLS